MKRSVTITVPVEPRPQPRQKIGNRRAYLPETHWIHAYKAAVRLAAERVWRGRPLLPMRTPITLGAVFVLSRPAGMKKPFARCPHTGANFDWDNGVKAIQDALTGVIWENDGSVWRCSGIEKVYAAVGESPHVVIVVIW